MDDHHQLAVVCPDQSPPGQRRSLAAAEVPGRRLSDRPPPPPYPQYRPDLPHPAPPRYAYRKENSAAGPRMVYVQPMRVETQEEPSADRQTDGDVFPRPCSSDVSPRRHVANDAEVAGNRLSPPTLPLRVDVRMAGYNRRLEDSVVRHPSVGHYLHPTAADARHARNDAGARYPRPTATNVHESVSSFLTRHISTVFVQCRERYCDNNIQ